MISSFLSLYIASTIQPQAFKQIKLNSEKEEIRIEELENPNLIIPTKNSQFIAPVIQAKATISIDYNSDTVLFEKNAHTKLPIASLTKLMTISIILEENDLSEVVTISENATNTEGSTMHLIQGEQITVENLIFGTLINSANDGAIALAEHNAGSTKNFVLKMNQKALKMGLLNTKFDNPVGWDSPNNYSTAYDIAKLGKYAYQKQLIRTATQTQNIEVKSVSSNTIHKLTSTNKLLGNEFLEIKGLKTGTTEAAGQCFISIAENKTNNDIITVILNSPDRFTETKNLIDWTFRAYTWK